jgi:predicted lipoprotein with Yx(FWY)xxD motif
MKQLRILMIALATFSTSAAWAGVVTDVKLSDGRTILGNDRGLTLYTYDNDHGSVPSCYGGCARAWPPVLVTAQDTLAAPLGSTTRTDGTLQLTVSDKPVYLYVGDSEEGSANGDGLGGIWHVIPSAE